MRTISKLVLSLMMVTGLSAQDDPAMVGFVRLVNAVAPGEGNTNLTIDGEEMYPKGYKLGQKTGGIGLKPGDRKLEVRKNLVESGKTTVDVKPGQTTTLIAFAEKVETDDEEEPFKWKARILKLKQKDAEKGFRLTVVSVCSTPDVTFQVLTEARQANELKTVKRFGTIGADLGMGRGDVELRLKGVDEVLCGLSLDEPGNYVAVLYEDGEGKIRALTFYDPKFVVAG